MRKKEKTGQTPTLLCSETPKHLQAHGHHLYSENNCRKKLKENKNTKEIGTLRVLTFTFTVSPQFLFACMGVTNKGREMGVPWFGFSAKKEREIVE
jgi:hypothetical protein